MYNKYKKRTKPTACRLCASDGSVHRSYFVICDKCIRSTKRCGKCEQPLDSAEQDSSTSQFNSSGARPLNDYAHSVSDAAASQFAPPSLPPETDAATLAARERADIDRILASLSERHRRTQMRSRGRSVLRYIARQPTAEDLKRIAKHRRRMEKRCTCTCHHNAGADAADGDCDGDQAANTSADQRATHENDDENGNGNENGNEECGSAASPAQDADSDSDSDSDSCCEAECHCEHNATGSDKAAAGGGGGGDGEGEQCCTCRAPPPAALVEHEDIYSILSKLRIVPQASKLDRLGRLPEDARVRLPAAAAAPTLTLTPGHEQQCAIAPAPAPSRRAPGSPAKHSSAADHRGELSDDEELEFEDFDD